MVEKKEKMSVREKKKMGEIAPWRPADHLQERNSMFGDFSRGGFQSMLGPIGPSWTRPWSPWSELPGVREPATDLVDAGKEYRVHAEILASRRRI